MGPMKNSAWLEDQPLPVNKKKKRLHINVVRMAIAMDSGVIGLTHSPLVFGAGNSWLQRDIVDRLDKASITCGPGDNGNTQAG